MDRIELAKVISALSLMTGFSFDGEQIRRIDELISRGTGAENARNLIRHLSLDRKIDAIKEYRTLTGDGLKESKDAIDTVTNRFRAATPGA